MTDEYRTEMLQAVQRQRLHREVVSGPRPLCDSPYFLTGCKWNSELIDDDLEAMAKLSLSVAADPTPEVIEETARAAYTASRRDSTWEEAHEQRPECTQSFLTAAAVIIVSYRKSLGVTS